MAAVASRLRRALSGGNHVQEKNGNAGVREVGGDAGAHGAGAEDRSAAHQERLGGDADGGGWCGGAHGGCPLADSLRKSPQSRPEDTEARSTGSNQP